MQTRDDMSTAALREAIREQNRRDRGNADDDPPQHRVVSAKKAEAVTTTGASSVFDTAGRAKTIGKKPLAPLVFEELEDAGPIPTGAKLTKFSDLFAKLEVGKGKLIDADDLEPCRRAAWQVRKNGGPESKKRYLFRTLSAIQAGVWRLPDAEHETVPSPSRQRKRPKS